MPSAQSIDTDLTHYALIGNCRSAALVSQKGSIDWCCLPEFHSASVFTALLDVERGGHFIISPAEEFQSTQLYIENTNVVETIFNCANGAVRLTDAFVAMQEEQKNSLFPDHEILRFIEASSGLVKMKFKYIPTEYYGREPVVLKNYHKLGIHFCYKENICVLQTSLDEALLQVSKGYVEGEFIVHEGEEVVFSFSVSTQHPAIIPEIKTTAGYRMQCTIDYWKCWAAKCRYEGAYKDWVVRSILTLKLLVHAPSGAIIAAPTSSLPEAIKGVRNWDYRFCWLRDASLTIRVLLKLGYNEEADAYMNWILHATQLTRPKIQVVYNVFGESKIGEKECDWLNGYRDSRPVHIGNAAHEQFQLDVYGEVLDAIYTYSEKVKEFDNTSRKFILDLGKVICKLWDQPDDGIWEKRSSRTHNTHSKAMAWVGLDRLIKLCRKYNWKDVPVDSFKKTAEEIKKQVELFGYNNELNSYTTEFNGADVDAALLLLPLMEYCEVLSPRMQGTIQFARKELTVGGLLKRYNTKDGLEGEEGAFVVCNYWLIEVLAKSGELKEAIKLFTTIMEHAGTSGLLSEEIDPLCGKLTGNYPQGFSHIGLVNAALTINEMQQKE
jgi:GH15 family glucan-1,4-alpha-glucosidase